MESVESRFLRYAAIDTQSDAASETFPSTARQLRLLGLLLEELLAMGADEASIDAWGYVTARIPATAEGPVIGLLAHIDTSPDLTGAGVTPRVVDYCGGEIVLDEDAGIVMRPSDFPELNDYAGQRLIVTDGATLLGADDKAGVAEIMAAAEYLLRHPEIPHGGIRIAFTPDEEIGRGVDHFDVAAFGADWAYTVDGGRSGGLEFENFNAAEAVVTIRGTNVHPGYACGKMVNALRVAMEFDALLPAGERPEVTVGREGFFHLTSLDGNVGECRMEYIVREFDQERFAGRKARVEAAAAEINRRYGRTVAEVALRDQYYNMYEKTASRPEIVELAAEAMRAAGIEPLIHAVRGGTDGARLSYMGLPCPNIFSGAENMHGRYEFV
ncbi:MAG: peptidase T, partial [Rikenellaceae bacterium]|nr:peptidase T [Rikenellaceae bacterium]